MTLHPGRSVALASVVVVVGAFCITGCGSRKKAEENPPAAAAAASGQPAAPSAPASVPSSALESFPEPIAKAWTQAGALVGLIREFPPSSSQFLPGKPQKAGDLPAFGFAAVGEGVLAKLPPPQQPFGITLQSAEVTDAGLKGLSRLDRLQTLYLDGSKLTDAVCKELVGLKGLERLSLSDNMTDAGLKELAGLKRLQKLYIDHAQVTDAGVQEFQKAVPSCKVIKE